MEEHRWHQRMVQKHRNIPNKSECNFIQLDIKEFYASITEKSLKNAIVFRENYISISKKNIRIVKYCRKSLFYGNEAWKAKDADTTFDVTMGSYDAAELRVQNSLSIQLLWATTQLLVSCVSPMYVLDELSALLQVLPKEMRMVGES